LLQYVVVPESQHAQALLLQPSGSLLIMQLLRSLGMLTSSTTSPCSRQKKSRM